MLARAALDVMICRGLRAQRTDLTGPVDMTWVLKLKGFGAEAVVAGLEPAASPVSEPSAPIAKVGAAVGEGGQRRLDVDELRRALLESRFSCRWMARASGSGSTSMSMFIGSGSLR